MTAKILKADELLHKNEAFKKISEIISRAFAFVGRPCHHDELHAGHELISMKGFILVIGILLLIFTEVVTYRWLTRQSTAD
ncbi:hypothetical protein HMPREF0530_0009 [Lacticaseibacillus paracasei subsp. paracasei ATCC 25302 = DSM 5622 = JCM 8130]|nr:hypothetical protein HMPREF0530_0009 [Lacticaseibacillus paracasei subsp. paracasei ATCC 25302 = DSM 5622 = JCM 8130]